MAVDFKLLERTLAEHKVYDAWQYVKSLHETLGYMNMSYNLINKVYEHRKNILESTKNEIIDLVLNEGNASITQDHLYKTNLDIAGYVIDDVAFLQKNSIEFFHYARVSMDVLFQIVNAALLGDQSYRVTDRKLLKNVLTKLNNNFTSVYQQLSTIKDDNEFKYLSAFDNYIKHIKTILITVKNSFMIGDVNEFYINEFVYNDVFYERTEALEKIKNINDYVIETVGNLLLEVTKQVPNCLDNSQRIQQIKFRMQVQKNKSKIDFLAFFIEVENDLWELPNEIKIYPLMIKPDDEIYSFDFRFEKIFIKKRNSSFDRDEIIGCADLKNGLETNEFYRVFEVKAASSSDYMRYIADFKNKDQKISLNFYAMEGQIVAYEDGE
ncbi:hypothetical protein P4H27_08020 [Paenibacillus taichungensis]|uniref:hypothetical protein n=1 Tax=Paenibacillus taichungensis TaxID=484184 RepID=UPI002DB75BDF|nr:hypothetical protein [Paenibacillus taichungensis]MEC0106883.1 hypothetical protein [Paenibacillus taichungensis]MEC0195187.1 hypothetical protein [Paenibacillus taichungensis]